MPDIFWGRTLNYHGKLRSSRDRLLAVQWDKTRAIFSRLWIFIVRVYSVTKRIYISRNLTRIVILVIACGFFTLLYRVTRKFHFFSVIKERILRIHRWICRNGFISYLHTNKLVKSAWFLRMNSLSALATVAAISLIKIEAGTKVVTLYLFC